MAAIHIGAQALKNFTFLLTAAITLAFPLVPAFAENPAQIEFRKDGEHIRTLSLDELRSIVPEVSLKVFEAHEQENRTYRAIPAKALFDKVFGKHWERAQAVVFTSLDGYQPSVPVTKMLIHDGYFAFASVGATPLRPNEQAAELRSRSSQPALPYLGQYRLKGTS